MAAAKIKMRHRMTVVLLVALVCFAVIIFKVFYIQIIRGNFMQEQAKEYRTRSLTVSASRGVIYDVNGNKMAVSMTADSIAAYPGQIKSNDMEDSVAESLSQLLDMDYNKVYNKITSDESFVWIKRKVDFDVAEKVSEAKLTGVTLVEETQRYYPFGTLAAHVIGFAGIDNQGLDGLEKTAEKWLVGTDGSIDGIYDAHEEIIPQTDYEYVAPQDGYGVYTTIDSNIQYFCERELQMLMNSETPPKRAGIIIMNPKDATILAMASTDPYDPNNYGDYSDAQRRNWLISDSYEPGSTFKTITLSTALETGSVSLNDRFYDGGSVQVANATIHCWSSVEHGQQNLAEAVANSCNPAFVAIAQKIENNRSGLFYEYINKFGYGQTTGIDLPGEAIGILQSESNRGPVEIATTGIGQGIAVTPIQMITAISAVANGGELLRPQIISKVTNGDEVVYQAEKEVVRRVISEDTAALVRELLVGVITDGSGANAAIDGYTVAGKTGTAQKAENGVYADGKYVASFVGMVPADDPQLVCLVVVDEPSGVHFGSQVAAPVFKSVMSDTLRYLGIEPDAELLSETTEQDGILAQVPNLVNLNVDAAVTRLKELGLRAEISGDGPLVTEQSPPAGYYIESGSTVGLTTGGLSDNHDGTYTVTVPNLYGKRLSASATLLAEMGLIMDPRDSGIVYSQDPAPGSKLQTGDTVTVWLRDERTVYQALE